ncbi:MAG: hypothetical protein IT383_21140 [Deltaproteobacteria bacterium]|nr:hypothetical protein [Deltaproteobacteria bacterium]
MPRTILVAIAVLAVISLAGCDDPCMSQQSPSVEIGRLVGSSEFEPFESGDEVVLGFAPQGGNGVMATLRTLGMSAHETMIIFPRSVSTEVRITGTDEAGAAELLGDFPLGASIYCIENSYGLVTNVVFGLDPAREDTPESLAGRPVTLAVDVSDENGAAASASIDVVFASLQ